MATIRDVAKLAGVSLGTVSNVLKGSTSVSMHNIEKVNQAIRELDYHPDPKARGLKSSASQFIGVVLPNITNQDYALFYTAAERTFSEHGYFVNLFLSNDFPLRETEFLNQILSQKYAGVLLCTCQPDNTLLFDRFHASSTKLVFIARQPHDTQRFNTVDCRNEASIQQAVQQLYQRGCRCIVLLTGPESYSCEQQCIQAFHSAVHSPELSDCRYQHLQMLHSRSSGYKAAVELYKSMPSVDAVICTDNETAKGLYQGFRFLSPDRIPYIAALKEDTWSDASDILPLPHAYSRIGTTAAELLLENMEKDMFFDMKHLRIDNPEVQLFYTDLVHLENLAPCTLRIAMPDNALCKPLLSLVSNFERHYDHNIHVEAEEFSRQELHALMTDTQKNRRYDIFLFDVFWLPELAENGILRNMTPDVGAGFLAAAKKHPQLFLASSMYQERCYAVPHVLCSQLLFYRQDLFSDYQNRRLFFEEYKTQLQSPATWSEFNAIARFFTRACNPSSPVTYGTSLCGTKDAFALIEYMSRLCSYGSGFFDPQGNPALDQPSSVTALRNYLESYQYANPKAADFTWEDQVCEFAAGDSAMMITYAPYATVLTDLFRSRISDRFHFATIPGKKPVVGGWSMGANNQTKHYDHVRAFINWSCAASTRTPLTMLGDGFGGLDSHILSMYPWEEHALQDLGLCVRRSLPEGKRHLSAMRFEEILSDAIHQCIKGQTAPEKALLAANQELAAFLGNESR